MLHARDAAGTGPNPLDTGRSLLAALSRAAGYDDKEAAEEVRAAATSCSHRRTLAKALPPAPRRTASSEFSVAFQVHSWLLPHLAALLACSIL